MNTRLSHKLAAAMIAASAIAATQCSRSPSTPTSTDLRAPSISFAVGDTTNSTPAAGQIKICKAGNADGTFDVASVSGAAVVAGPNFAVATGTCRVAATSSVVGAEDLVSLTETSQGLQSATINPALGGSTTFTSGGTINFNGIHGHTVTFTNNVPPPPPPPGDKGCTPGYWKQTHHFDSWPAGYAQSASFNTTFGIGTNWFPDSLSLLAALGQGGGDVNALGRQATAALLNAASGFYPLTTAQVIARVQATYAGTFGVEDTKNYFAAFNETVCPLN